MIECAFFPPDSSTVWLSPVSPAVLICVFCAGRSFVSDEEDEEVDVGDVGDTSGLGVKVVAVVPEVSSDSEEGSEVSHADRCRDHDSAVVVAEADAGLGPEDEGERRVDLVVEDSDVGQQGNVEDGLIEDAGGVEEVDDEATGRPCRTLDDDVEVDLDGGSASPTAALTPTPPRPRCVRRVLSTPPPDADVDVEACSSGDEGEVGASRCPMCPATFRRADHRTRHLQCHLSPPRQHRCDGCNASFNRNDQLQAHRRLHGGEWPYRCVAVRGPGRSPFAPHTLRPGAD